MGIQGLLIGLKPYTVHGNIIDYAGTTVAVDASSWLHKSVYSIADHYVECVERNRIDQRCIDVSARYILQRCRELHDGFRIAQILLVVDGKRSPLKVGTNQERDDRRRENLRLARQYVKQQRKDAAFDKYKSCIKIMDALTVPVVQLVAQRLHGYVQIVWSPYEADPQLAQVCIDGRATVCITEDSDVLVYSASAQVSFPIIYKLDRTSGTCDIVSMDWLLRKSSTTSTSAGSPPAYQRPPKQQQPQHHRPLTKKQDISQLQVVLNILRSRQQQNHGWGARLFVMACVLAGCDYAPRQILGVGLVKAFQLVRDAGLTGSDTNLAKLFRYIIFSALPPKSRGSVKDCDALEEQLAQSEAVFYYHPVQNRDGRIIHFTSRATAFSPNIDRFADCSFLGSLVANDHDHRSGIIPENHTASPIKTKPIHQYYSTAKNKSLPKTPPKRQALVAKRPDSATSSLSSPSVDYDNAPENIANFVTVAKKKNYNNNNKLSEVNKLSVRHRHDDDDVRFVKRKFPKDGTRTIHPRQKLVPTMPPQQMLETRNERFKRAFSRPLSNHNSIDLINHDEESRNNNKRSRFFYETTSLAGQQPKNYQRGDIDLCEPDGAMYSVHAATDRRHAQVACRLLDRPEESVHFQSLDDAPVSNTAFQSPKLDPAVGNDPIFSCSSPDLLLVNHTLGCEPDPTMDSENLFYHSSPNLLLDPTQGDERSEHEAETYVELAGLEVSALSEARRVTMAELQPTEQSFNPAFDFYYDGYAPMVHRPAKDPDVFDLQQDDAESEDVFDVICSGNISHTVSGPPRERSTIGPAKIHRDRYQITSFVPEQGRKPFHHLRSFLAKNRKRRSTGSPSSLSGKKQKQTSILSHFRIGAAPST